MRKFYTTLIFLGTFYQLHGQKTEHVSLNKSEFNKLVYENFTSIINSDNKGVLGNFASVDSDKNEIKFGATFIKRNEFKKFPAALTFNIKGGNSNDVIPIFSDSELSSFGVDLNAHILYKPKKSTIEYDVDKLIDRKKNREKIIDKYDLKLNYLSFPNMKNSLNFNLVDFKLKHRSYRDSLNSLIKEIIKLNDQVLIYSDSLQLIKKLTNIKKDTAVLRQKIEIVLPEKINATKDSLEVFLKNDSTIFYDLESQLLLSRRNELSKLNKIEALGYKIKWITVRIGLDRTSFKLFNESLAIVDGIRSANHTMPSFALAFNSYSRSVFRNAWFWSTGVTWESGNNLDSLSTVTVIERTNYGAESNQYFSNKETTAFTGSYRGGLESFKVYADSYYFLDRNEIIAIHLNPNLLFISKNAIFSTSVGAFISFKKKDKPESFLNAEVFYNFFDITNELNNEEFDLLDRGNFGLRVAFPINFKTNK